MNRVWTTARLFGGLGNQLFQYAAGRAVAERTGTKLRLDACYVEIEPDRHYELNHFRIRAKVLREPPRPVIGYTQLDVEQRYAEERYGATICREWAHEFQDELAAAQPNSFLVGYWQSEKYFAHLREPLRRELRPRHLSRPARAAAKRVAASPAAVAVHVRRGDYVEDPVKLRNHGICSPEYYEQAAAIVGEQVDGAEYFVFSDDPDWCRQHISLPGQTHHMSGELAGFEDMHVMSCCRHWIVANSSFSWWAAWLGERPDSVIVAPSKWFDEMERDTRDQVPDRWLKI
ncbi:MAG: alpha-1,2-fucosyltransferase [Solirubrobacterales bacterium]